MENTEENKSVEIAKNQECQELKNIKYKTMLLNGQPLQETKLANDLSNLDFLRSFLHLFPFPFGNYK